MILSDLLPEDAAEDSLKGLSEVFVELELTGCEQGKRGALSEMPLTGGWRVELRELMRLGGTAEQAPRWVVRGDPGAGKSTLARHLALRLARNNANADMPVAIYASLPALALEGDERRSPFDQAEADLCRSGSGCGKGLTEALRRRGAEQGRLWLLLDGWDEVSREHREAMRACLKTWSANYPQVAIAVFSRRVGYAPIGGPYQQFAAVQPLDRDRQIQLLTRWGIQPPRANQILDGLSLGLKEAC